MVRDQVSTELVEKWLSISLQVRLGQRLSVVQGRCSVATANSSYAKAQNAYNELNRVNDQGSPCMESYLQLHLVG